MSNHNSDSLEGLGDVIAAFVSSGDTPDYILVAIAGAAAKLHTLPPKERTIEVFLQNVDTPPR